ncbi:Nucleosome-remodeling factor subunit BPTF [Manis javanica]|nr:Nucleosome-remodeling factor subunit BPTF [Manis javanica]
MAATLGHSPPVLPALTKRPGPHPRGGLTWKYKLQSSKPCSSPHPFLKPPCSPQAKLLLLLGAAGETRTHLPSSALAAFSRSETHADNEPPWTHLVTAFLVHCTEKLRRGLPTKENQSTCLVIFCWKLESASSPIGGNWRFQLGDSAGSLLPSRQMAQNKHHAVMIKMTVQKSEASLAKSPK